ncbi:Vasa-related protein PoVAS1 [Aphelenchoides avenae]|nr:Vasa-related protein PoVAS1 [Aphelenchus avenae]
MRARANQNGNKRTDGGDSWQIISFPQRQLKYGLITQEQYDEARKSGFLIRVPPNKAQNDQDLNDDPPIATKPASEEATDKTVVSGQHVADDDWYKASKIPFWKNVREVTGAVKTNLLTHVKTMKPSPLQWAILHEFAKGTDIYLKAGGPFKPDLCLIPLISKLVLEDEPENDGSARDCFEPKALVLAPSVKRCMQEYVAARKLANGTSLRIRYSHGQQGVDRDFAQFEDGCDLLCITVQRLGLLLDIGAVSPHRISYLLVAQVHELLSEDGFLERLQDVLADYRLPSTSKRQTVFMASCEPSTRISDIVQAHMKGSHKVLTD